VLWALRAAAGRAGREAGRGGAAALGGGPASPPGRASSAPGPGEEGGLARGGEPAKCAPPPPRAPLPCPPRAAQVIMNPFHTPSTKISSKDFDKKVKTVAKRTLG
jgi:hypothetical protein